MSTNLTFSVGETCLQGLCLEDWIIYASVRVFSISGFIRVGQSCILHHQYFRSIFCSVSDIDFGPAAGGKRGIRVSRTYPYLVEPSLYCWATDNPVQNLYLDGYSAPIGGHLQIMTTQKKDCFGILESVFPMGKEGLREIIPTCFECAEKKACLQTALKTEEGFQLRSEVLDRSPANGFLGKLRRWSERKELSRLSKLHRGEKK